MSSLGLPLLGPLHEDYRLRGEKKKKMENPGRVRGHRRGERRSHSSTTRATSSHRCGHRSGASRKQGIPAESGLDSRFAQYRVSRSRAEASPMPCQWHHGGPGLRDAQLSRPIRSGIAVNVTLRLLPLSWVISTRHEAGGSFFCVLWSGVIWPWSS